MRKAKYILIILILLIVWIPGLTGQDSLSIVQENKAVRTRDSIAASVLIQEARGLLGKGQTDSTMILLTMALSSASENNFTLIAARGFEMLATIYETLNNWEEMLRNLFRAEDAYLKAGEKMQEAAILKKISEKYFELGIYLKSAQYSEKEFTLYSDPEYALLAFSAEAAAKSYYYALLDSLAAKWYNAAAFYFSRAGNEEGNLICREKLGSLYIRLSEYERAASEYNTLLSFYQKNDMHQKTAGVFNQLGFVSFRLGERSKALEYFTLAAESSVKSGEDHAFMTDVWSNIAVCHQNDGSQREMLTAFRTALEHAEKANMNNEAARISRILSTIYFNSGDNYHAEMYCLDCIEAAAKAQDHEILHLCYRDYSEVLEKGNDFIRALEYYEKYLNIRDSINLASVLSKQAATERQKEFEETEQRIRNEIAAEEIEGLELKNLKAESARRENEIRLLINERALERSERDRQLQAFTLERERLELARSEQELTTLRQQQLIDSLNLQQKEREAQDLALENQLLEADRLQKETQLRNEKLAKQLSLGAGLLMFLLAAFILYGLLSTRRKNQKLAESKRKIEQINSDLEIKNAEIINQKELIEQKSQAITDSIQYASRIQEAVFPPISFLADWGLDNFILFRPKDIVSGDFYWGMQKNDKILVAAVDCTGHGVPGAFMSMLGHTFLDEIVNTKDPQNAAGILNHLRDEVINTLKQKGSTGEARDGMDISLCIIDRAAGRLDFAGANNPLYLVRNGNLLRYTADKMPIGIHFISYTSFMNQSVEILPGDTIYLFSDGYADQFGGPKGRKFMYKQFQDLLLKINDQPMQRQKELLEEAFLGWMGEHDQVDDVLVIGIRI